MAPFAVAPQAELEKDKDVLRLDALENSHARSITGQIAICNMKYDLKRIMGLEVSIFSC